MHQAIKNIIITVSCCNVYGSRVLSLSEFLGHPKSIACDKGSLSDTF